MPSRSWTTGFRFVFGLLAGFAAFFAGFAGFFFAIISPSSLPAP
jgi:preprotein translocase subunit SecE